MKHPHVALAVLLLSTSISIPCAGQSEKIGDLSSLMQAAAAQSMSGFRITPHTPCFAGFVGCSQTVSGRVSVDSCNADSLYAVGYIFNGTQGQIVTISGTSLEFAATILLADARTATYVTLTRADVFQTGQSAVIRNYTLPFSGDYAILITPGTRVTFGNYTISITCAAAPPPTGSCSETSTTACMLNSRFRVSVRYRGAFDNSTPNTSALKKSVIGFSNPAYETAFFYFNDSNNIEMMVKLLDQGNTDSIGRRTIAVLFGSATPLRIEVTITDTLTGASRTYNSFFNEMKGATDFTAFVK